MFEPNMLKIELRNFFTRKYRLAILALGCFAALC